MGVRRQIQIDPVRHNGDSPRIQTIRRDEDISVSLRARKHVVHRVEHAGFVGTHYPGEGMSWAEPFTNNLHVDILRIEHLGQAMNIPEWVIAPNRGQDGGSDGLLVENPPDHL